MTESIDLKHYRQLLETQLEALTKADNSTKDATRPVELDQTTVGRLSRMDAMQVQAMALAEKNRRTQHIQRIKAALQRMEDGEYGYCLQCGEAIASKRLELDASLTTCIHCASGAPPN